MTDEANFAIDGGHEKVTIRRGPPGSKSEDAASEVVYCVGEDTVFYLVRAPGAKEFVVAGTGSTPSDRAAYQTLFARFLRAHCGINGRPMSRVMTSPGFRIIDAERIVSDGRSLVKVECEIGTRQPKDRASVVFDPEAGWVIRSTEYRPGIAPESRSLAAIEYGPSQDGLPLPRRVTFREAGEELSCEFLTWSFDPTARVEYTMSYYGLPDLVSKAGRSRRYLPYWLSGIAVVGLVLAFVLRRTSNRNLESVVS
jgi:hypothetical protein